jgi:hypothetical protein
MRWVHRPDRQCGDDEDASQQKPWQVLVGSFFTYSFLPIYVPKIISPQLMSEKYGLSLLKDLIGWHSRQSAEITKRVENREAGKELSI